MFDTLAMVGEWVAATDVESWIEHEDFEYLEQSLTSKQNDKVILIYKPCIPTHMAYLILTIRNEAKWWTSHT